MLLEDVVGTSSTPVHYCHGAQQGSVRALASSIGSIANTYTCDALRQDSHLYRLSKQPLRAHRRVHRRRDRVYLPQSAGQAESTLEAFA